jgi:hypothetical protein
MSFLACRRNESKLHFMTWALVQKEQICLGGGISVGVIFPVCREDIFTLARGGCYKQRFVWLLNVSFIPFWYLNLFNRINQSISRVKARISPCNSQDSIPPI